MSIYNYNMWEEGVGAEPFSLDLPIGISTLMQNYSEHLFRFFS